MGSQRVRYDLATKVKNFCRAVGEVGDAMEESASFGEAGTRSRPLHCLPPPGDSSKEERPFLPSRGSGDFENQVYQANPNRYSHPSSQDPSFLWQLFYQPERPTGVFLTNTPTNILTNTPRGCEVSPCSSTTLSVNSWV